MSINQQELRQVARESALQSYSPYSRFRVGACLVCGDGSLYSGANVENRSFGLTVCAERTAAVKAVSEGKRDFKAIFIYSPDSIMPLPPCGACRQVLSEFGGPQMLVYYAGGNSKIICKTLGELYPEDSLHDLAENQGL